MDDASEMRIRESRPPGGRSAGERHVVLVVDDDPVVRLLALEALGAAGYSLVEAADGAEGLQVFEEIRPNLVLLDVNMPKVDGYEVCARLRETPAGAHLPILMMTAPQDTETIHRAYEAGATDFVLKPVTWALLGYRIRYALRDTARTLLEVTSTVASTLDLSEVLRRTTREIVRAVGADTGGAWLLTPDKTGFLPIAAYRAPKERIGTFQEGAFPITADLVEWAQQLPGPIFAPDSQSDPKLSHEVFQLIPHKSLLVLPLRDGEGIIGAFVVAWMHDRAQITRGEVRLGEAIASQATIAVRNARLHAEIRKRDEQILHGQKMEVVGRLAGGIAHDFNNLLTVVLANSQLLGEELRLTEAQRKRHQTVVAAANRAAGLVRQLMTFSRKDLIQPKVLDLNAMVEAITKMLGRLLGDEVKLVVDLDPALGRVKADPGQLEQVIMNLAVNARDAMPGGGCLTLETTNTEVSPADATQTFGARAGSYVLLAVRDTGVGMDEHTVARIFEPFFTTKPPEKGTGLGLATVHGIVTGAGGFICVKSALGSGSTFEIRLPRTQDEARAPEASQESAGLPRGTETVLVVEDHVEVRTMVADVLRGCGYDVLEAEHGVEALERLRSTRAPVGLLLTDVAMPYMGGIELAQQVRVEHPSTKILYMSGHVDNEALGRALDEGQLEFLPKPFTVKSLAGKVRELLGTPRAEIPGGAERTRSRPLR